MCYNIYKGLFCSLFQIVMYAIHGMEIIYECFNAALLSAIDR